MALLVQRGQFRVAGIDDEDRERACRYGFTGAFADDVTRAAFFKKAFAGPINLHGFAIDLAADGSGQHECVDEGGFRWLGDLPPGGGRDDANEGLALDTGDFVLECWLHGFEL